MSILDKFDLIQKKDALSEFDRAECNRMYDQYKTRHSFYTEMHQFYQNKISEIQKPEISFGVVYLEDVSQDLLDTFQTMKEALKADIYDYFIKRYGVKLNYERDSEQNRYSSDPKPKTEEILQLIDYEPFIEDINEQLGGLSFDDLHVQQIKEKLHDICYNSYRETWNFEIKGEKIIFNSLIYWSKRFSDEYECNISDSQFIALAYGLAMYEYNRESVFPELSHLLGRFYVKWYEIDQNTIINRQKIKSIKFYKNDRVDIIFQKPEYAREFATEWCRRPLVAA